MTVYVDDAAILWRGKLRYHLIADSPTELLDFANALGIKRCWYHNPGAGRFPHYDVTPERRAAAVASGALEVSSRDVVRILREQYPG